MRPSLHPRLRTLLRAHDSFLAKAAASVGVKAGNVAVTFLFLLYFARVLGPDEFGVFAFVLSAANFAAIAAGLGQPMTLIRFLPGQLALGEHGAARGLLGFAVRRALLGAGLGALAMTAFGALAPRFGAPDAPAAYVAGAALLAALAGAELASHLLRGFGSVWAALAPRDLAWRVLATGGAAGLAIAGVEFGAAAGLWIAAVTLGGLVAGQCALALARAPAALRSARPHLDELGSWRASSLRYWGIAIASAVTQYLTIVVIGFAFSDAETGAFFAAFRIASLLSLPLMAANIVLAPMIARYWRQENRDGVQQVVRVFLAVAAAPTAVGFIALSALGGPVLSLFSPEYAGAARSLTILGAGFFVNTLTGPCGYVMTMTGAEGRYLRYTAAAGLLTILGAAVLSPFGMEASAAAVAGASILLNLRASGWCRRNLGLETTAICLRPRG